MSGFTELNLKNEYRTSTANMACDFYEPILKNAFKYDRAVGFFSSSSLAYITEGLIPFIQNEGHIRIIASPVLSEEDVEAIKHGYKKREEIIQDSLIRELDEVEDISKQKRLNLLSNLIADGRLDIKIALTDSTAGFGIYHEKMGIFTDLEGNKVAFSGSMNETITAMSINYEAIDVFCSWKGEENQERVQAKADTFELIWINQEPSVTTWYFPDVNETIISRYKRDKVDYTKLKAEEYQVMNENRGEKQQEVPIINGARIPKDFVLYDYQKNAINNWKNMKFRGIFDMATGTGKTYTGLGAIATLSEYLEDKLGVIIVCPYQHLVEQWKEDILLFGIQPIVGYGAIPDQKWKKPLETAIRDQKLKVKKREFFCFVTTNATFSGVFVQEQIKKIRGNILLLVDEAHNFGAENLRELLNNKFEYRLALSATLNRHGDEIGTQALLNYFGEKCIEYSLDRAIEEKKLTPYKYYPILVYLSENERNIYDDLSIQIIKNIIKGKNGKIKLNDKGKKLALKRARVVAGAGAKISQLEKAIMPYLHDRHILVYCGATRVLDSEQESSSVDDEDLRQIDLVTHLLGNKLNINVSQFTSKEKIDERAVLKKEFSSGENLQALIAIKCLDEGVNIPKIKVAFILASTTNPKEYIQRRGRVLRLADGKEYAEIYDFITLPRPLDEVSSLTEQQMKREISLVKNELCRAIEFARIAMNKVTAIAVIDDIIEAYNLQEKVLDFEEEYGYGE